MFRRRSATLFLVVALLLSLPAAATAVSERSSAAPRAPVVSLWREVVAQVWALLARVLPQPGPPVTVESCGSMDPNGFCR